MRRNRDRREKEEEKEVEDFAERWRGCQREIPKAEQEKNNRRKTNHSCHEK